MAYFDGSWKGRIRYRLQTRSSNDTSPAPSTSTSKSDLTTVDDEWTTLLDLNTLHTVSKSVRPLEKQLPTESRKLWQDVTSRLLNKEYGEATKYKQAIEQKQRDDAAERKKNGVELVFPTMLCAFTSAYQCSCDRFIPRYFDKDIGTGIPRLTEEGMRIVEEELAEDSVCVLEAKQT
jgi:oxysterol-binding protein-related protein 9/10/11